MRLAALLAVAALALAGCAKEGGSPTGGTGSGCAGVARASLTLSNASNPVVALETAHGCIVAELYQDKAPITVANFLAYTDAGFFDGTLIHRISKGFVLQGGGVDAETEAFKQDLRPPIKNEARTSGLHNEAYTLSMARTTGPDTATSQFFINLKDNRDCLDAVTGRCDQSGNGYAVFGKVVHGTDAVEAIHQLPVTTHDRHPYCLRGEQSCPVDPVAIQSVRRL